jgi:hypothetical protein
MFLPESSTKDGSTDTFFLVLALFAFPSDVTLDVPATSSAKQTNIL